MLIARKISSAVGSLLAPPSCWVTGRPLREHEVSLSGTAREEITRGMLLPFCRNCGATTGHYAEFNRKHPCPECDHRDLLTQSIIRVGTYDGALAKLVTTLKFNRRFEVAKLLGVYLHQAMTMHTRDGTQPPIDLLIPVPLHWRRLWLRGFNQAEEITRAAAKLGHWPMAKMLWRIRANNPQTSKFSRNARRLNVEDVFWCEPGHLAGKHVWLIDDVCTTGATLRAATAAIRRLPQQDHPAGIHAAVIAVTDHRKEIITPEPDEMPRSDQ